MHIVIIADHIDVASELTDAFLTCGHVKEFSYISVIEDLFDLKESSLIDAIFIFLDQSSELGAVLFTEIQDQIPELRRKVVIVSPLSENLSRNHMVENVLSYPLDSADVLKVIDDFYIEQED